MIASRLSPLRRSVLIRKSLSALVSLLAIIAVFAAGMRPMSPWCPGLCWFPGGPDCSPARPPLLFLARPLVGLRAGDGEKNQEGERNPSRLPALFYMPRVRERPWLGPLWTVLWHILALCVVGLAIAMTLAGGTDRLFTKLHHLF